MCNRIFGPMPGYTVQNRRIIKKTPLPKIDSTPQPVVEKMLELINPSSDDILYDLGCGDGRFVITAAKKYGCKAVGIEINRAIANKVYRRVKREGLDNLVKIYCGDARKSDISDASIIVLYLFPDLIEELQPTIFTASKIISYSHRIPNQPNTEMTIHVDGKNYPVYIWQNPWSLHEKKENWSLKARGL